MQNGDPASDASDPNEATRKELVYPILSGLKICTIGLLRHLSQQMHFPVLIWIVRLRATWL